MALSYHVRGGPKNCSDTTAGDAAHGTVAPVDHQFVRIIQQRPGVGAESAARPQVEGLGNAVGRRRSGIVGKCDLQVARWASLSEFSGLHVTPLVLTIGAPP
jgi:hypothetical protein